MFDGVDLQVAFDPDRQETLLGRYMAGCLAARSGLDGQDRQRFGKIVHELSSALGEGHICIAVDEDQRALLRRSPLVTAEGGSGGSPLVLSGDMLYFGRYFRYESELASALCSLARVTYQHPAIRNLAGGFSDGSKNADIQQREAARVALTSGLCIVGGGPGTGKTTTIVQIAGLLLACCGAGLKIALAAPTGKAAMRMRESIKSQISAEAVDATMHAAFAAGAQTLHRLLGLYRFSARPKYHAGNPMSHDLVIVDEASMIDLALMAKLVVGLKPGARLVLLGDRDQLASVESGSVLADCMAALPAQVVELRTRYRFSQEIAALSDAIKSGDADCAWQAVNSPASSALGIIDRDWLETIGETYGSFMREACQAESEQQYQALFTRFDAFRILCAVNGGPFGVREMNRLVELKLARLGYETSQQHWYVGRPVLITRNDYNLELFNGDIGLCLPDPGSCEGLAVWFEGRDKRLRRYLPGQISSFETAWAMTIHKSQGSEYDQICIVLGDRDNQVLCRELLYTAVTRARTKIGFIMDETIFRSAIARRTLRRSGLAARLRSSYQQIG